jgi:hypothetical protein
MAAATHGALDCETRTLMQQTKTGNHMPGKMTLTITADAKEAEILIAALRDQAANIQSKEKAEILDRLAYEIEEQVG